MYSKGIGTVTKVYVPKNAIRIEMVEKAKRIFDFVFDHDSPEITLSGIIDQLAQYETEWSIFPKSTAQIALIANDKLSALLKNRGRDD